MTTDNSSNKIKRRVFSLLLPLVVITIVMGYFQLFYKSADINNNLCETTLVLEHSAQVRAVKFSPNDSLIASGSVDKTVRVWNAADGKLVQTLQHPEGITYLAYTPDGKMIVTTSYDGIIRLWDLSTGRVIKEMNPNTGVVWTLAVSPDGQMIASSGEGKTIDVWELQTGKLVNSLKGHTRNVWSVRFSADGTLLASGSFDATVKIWNVADGKQLKDLTSHTEAVVDLNFSNNGRWLATTSDDKTIRLWILPEVSEAKKLKVPEHIQAAAFSPDDKWLLTGGRDKPMIGEFLQEIFGDSHANPGVSVRLWDPATGKLMQTLDDHYNDVNDLSWSHDGNFFATASEDKTVRVYKMSTVVKGERAKVKKESKESNGSERSKESHESNGDAECEQLSLLFTNSLFIQ